MLGRLRVESLAGCRGIPTQPYSLNDMLNNDQAVVDRFVGGDVYQVFVSATKYHRWHSPVSGTIKKASIKQGSYYSATEALELDPASPIDSQGYIAHVATRAIIYIEAEDPAIGLMVMMPLGMAEVSSCVLLDTIKEGYKVKRERSWDIFSTAGHPMFWFSGPESSRSSLSRKTVNSRWGRRLPSLTEAAAGSAMPSGNRQ